LGMRRAIRLLLVGMFAMLMLVPMAPIALAEEEPVAAQQTTTAPPTAPTGVEINAPQAPDKSRQKLVLGVTAALLLAIVVVGRRNVNKRRKKAKGAVSG
jgi:hypothetical protein